MNTPDLFLFASLVLLTGCGATDDTPATAARATFVIFLCFLAGIFFVGRHSMGLLQRLGITRGIKKHVWRLCVATYAIGAALTLPSLACAVAFEHGKPEAISIAVMIIGLCFVLTALCLKRWDETGKDIWLRRNIQVVYVGVVCFVSISYFISSM